jgi:hypothetical protein
MARLKEEYTSRIVPELEKKLDTWEHQHNLAASIVELDKAGFDMMLGENNICSHINIALERAKQLL